MDTRQVVILAVGLGVLLLLTVIPQWRNRKRREKQMSELGVGNEVMTVGGIIGTVTHIDQEQNRARIEIAPGVEMRVALAAISRGLDSGEAE
jgi:preprotein translocase subunit YajC